MLLTTILLTALLGVGAAASPLSSPSSRSCTPSSYTNITNFILREYQIDTITTSNSAGQLRGTLSVENPGTGDIYKLDRINISTGGGVWSVCVPGKDAPLPSQLVRCQYLIEKISNRIGFRFQWYCDDKDATYVLKLGSKTKMRRNGNGNGKANADVVCFKNFKTPVRRHRHWRTSH
ncbi:hypothetical protein QBC43DRAFT_321088 [Cladorrhinum sp. PSN259]|nr:hypothetical protein QBC43DRAFT_321088 [Cladorrhinum sp. PSN259]